MYQKQQQNNYHASENISLMVANVTQIKSGAMINAGVSAKISTTFFLIKYGHFFNLFSTGSGFCISISYLQFYNGLACTPDC